MPGSRHPFHLWKNLAAAVQVLTYEINMASLAQAEDKFHSNHTWDMPYATSKNIELFFKHMEETLTGIEFHDPDNPKQLMTRMRRLFMRVRMDEMEVSILRGLLSAIQRN